MVGSIPVPCLAISLTTKHSRNKLFWPKQTENRDTISTGLGTKVTETTTGAGQMGTIIAIVC